MDLYIIHVIFITVMASVSFLWGEWSGRSKGREEMVFDLLKRKLVTQKQLEQEYID